MIKYYIYSILLFLISCTNHNNSKEICAYNLDDTSSTSISMLNSNIYNFVLTKSHSKCQDLSSVYDLNLKLVDNDIYEFLSLSIQQSTLDSKKLILSIKSKKNFHDTLIFNNHQVEIENISFKNILASTNKTCALSYKNLIYCFDNNDASSWYTIDHNLGQISSLVLKNDLICALSNGVLNCFAIETKLDKLALNSIENVNNFDLGKQSYCYTQSDNLTCNGSLNAKIFNVKAKNLAFGLDVNDNDKLCAIDLKNKVYCIDEDYTSKYIQGRADLYANNDFHATDIKAYGQTFCALNNAQVFCFGGELDSRVILTNKNLDISDEYKAFKVKYVKDILDFNLSLNNFCLIDSNADLVCSGSNKYYVLGDDKKIKTRKMTHIQLNQDNFKALDVSISDQHICAIDLNSNTYCWGNIQDEINHELIKSPYLLKTSDVIANNIKIKQHLDF